MTHNPFQSRNNFRFLPSSYFHSKGPNESTRTKILKKIDQKDGQNQSRRYVVQKNAILTRLKYKTGIFAKLE